ncbi:MAG: glycerophosphodiester phosphodiesterase family protein [Bacteroidales bacterium]|nr:glycerophosphodiester phosphodiesterase family protein [Bacteroidales bacterium]
MKRGLSIMLALFAFSTGLFAQTRAETLRAKLLDPSDPTVFVAAHRGAWREAPENSLDAIEKAIEMGVEIVEIDVRKTLGGELILHHNPILFRPAGAPTLEEALLAAKDRVLINLDKAFGLFDEVMEVAERTGTVEQIIIKSSREAHKVLEVLGPYRDRVIFMPIINLNPSGAIAKVEAYVQKLDPKIYELTFYDDANPALTIVRARLAGRSRIWYDSLWPSLCGGHDDAKPMAEGIGWLIDNGAGAIQTDIPRYMIEYLKTR